jgi:hypothetical protein
MTQPPLAFKVARLSNGDWRGSLSRKSVEAESEPIRSSGPAPSDQTRGSHRNGAGAQKLPICRAGGLPTCGRGSWPTPAATWQTAIPCVCSAWIVWQVSYHLAGALGPGRALRPSWSPTPATAARVHCGRRCRRTWRGVPDVIDFSIAGAGPLSSARSRRCGGHDPLILDGYSQPGASRTAAMATTR